MDSEQPSFTDIEYGNRRRVSRRETFLATMDATIPWQVWVGLIEPHYYRPVGGGKKGRKPKPDRHDAADVSAAGVVRPVR